jgi:hypothetical protein
MAVTEINSSSFEFYEGLRVLLPGGMVVGLYSAAAVTFGGADAHLRPDAFTALALAFLTGLFLLFLDVPAGAAVFSYLSPVSFLDSWEGIRPFEGASTLTAYYEVLDTEVPAAIRSRTYYLGAIYRIGFEALYFSAAALWVVGFAIVFPSVGRDREGTDSATLRSFLATAATAHVLAVLAVIWARYNDHRRKGRQPVERLLADFRTEIPSEDRLVLAIGVTATVLFACGGPRWFGVIGIALPSLVWAVRYFHGVSRPSLSSHAKAAGTERDAARTPGAPSRQNLHAESAAVLFGIAAISLYVSGAIQAPANSPLSPAVAAGWIAVTLAAALLVGTRTHEKRLLGSYSSQRAWFSRNQDELVKKGYFVKIFLESQKR